MASSSKNSAAIYNLLGKRERGVNLETQPILKKHKEKSENKESTEGFADNIQQIKRRVDLLETKSDQANKILVKETVEGLDEPPDFVEEISLRKKTLFVGQLSPNTRISDIINFFKDVEVYRVRLIVNHKGKRVGCGFVEFASSKEAKKALEKNGEILRGHKIFLQVAKIAPYPPQHKYCIDHKVCYEDYLQRESLLIGEDEPVEGRDEPPDFVEKVLFVANLSPQTKILHINDFFNYVGEVVSVRLIVNHEGKHVGYGFVEFASANEAKKALEKKNGEYLHDHKIFLQVAKIVPYPPQHKYTLAEFLCYEDYLRQESLLIAEDELVEGCVKPTNYVEAVAVRKKTLFFVHLSRHNEMSHIISFFKDVGEVVSVRLIVNHKGKHVGYGFVEFAAANEAKKALQKKKGGILLGKEIILDEAKIAPKPPPKHCLDHKVWYEDYLRRESLLIEDEAVEGLDEPPDFVEEVAVRKKTLFVANLSPQTKISDINKFFKNVGEVVSVRLIVNHEGKHVGCGFVEFASANEAKKVLQKKSGEVLRGHKTFLQVAKIAPYPPRPKYTLAEMLWYEGYLRRESLLIEEDDLETKEKSEEKVPKMGVFSGKKTTFSDDE